LIGPRTYQHSWYKETSVTLKANWQTRPLLLHPFSVHCTNCHMSKLKILCSWQSAVRSPDIQEILACTNRSWALFMLWVYWNVKTTLSLRRFLFLLFICLMGNLTG